MTAIARQGHVYLHTVTGAKLMAMETGPVVEVQAIDQSRPWPLTPAGHAFAYHLQPLPMTYFAGQVPR